MKIQFANGEKENIRLVGIKIAEVLTLTDSAQKRMPIERFLTDDGYDFYTARNGKIGYVARNGNIGYVVVEDGGVYVPNADIPPFTILKF
jgi:hypothetical protein